MKNLTKILLITSLIILNSSFIINSQNLVPNPSFEDYLYCPAYPGDLYAIPWGYYIGKTPDYYNSCNNNYVSVPNNILGYQIPVTGVAYVGLFTRAISNTVLNYRETIGCPLNNSLVIGEKYYISFFASLADKSNCATNNLGVLFSTVTIDFDGSILNTDCFKNIYYIWH